MNGMEEFELVFPCEYAIKVIGRDIDGFELFVKQVVTQHVPEVIPDSFSKRSSRELTYLSVTVEFLAESREQLDALYHELGQDPRVKVIL